ncbi:hypothetical protein K435DRAFT_858310 [Dendrothele bispora CBS 962.96]|uniref:Integrase core domain-containing protein n=1 Tax=Dendrothele bispora (strain CBS 962.96) TaxID=1314807 RepID=A0A4S8M3E8_DENBC|nr:hypothetical protein K435DRAFT_858310 [Dendrothele bispora CBS 962.96]
MSTGDPANAAFNRNPKGKNQYASCSSADDPTLQEALIKYHRRKVTNNEKIAKLLEAEYGITMSASTVKNRRATLGLKGSRGVMKTMDETGTAQATQMILNELSNDPSQRAGVRTIQAKVAYSSAVHLPRHLVSDVMHTHAIEGFDKREPATKKINRTPKVPLGIHHRWAGDGHDKLYKIGFPIWAIVDDATGKYLDAWVVPSNRMADIVAYCFLLLVEKYGGIPIQFTTDCGSETTALYGLINALREIFYPECPTDELPAHVYLRSVHNISVERSWLRLRLNLGDNAVSFYHQGIDAGIYNPNDANHYLLCQWLWPVVLRKELRQFMEFRNGVKMRKDKDKPGPSGISRDEAFTLYEDWGGQNFLMPVDVSVIREIKETMGGDGILEFVPAEFASRAQKAYDGLGISELTMKNVWDVFHSMLPILFPEP